MMCERCKRNPIFESCGEFVNTKLFKKPIGLCRECYDDWGKIWSKSKILNLQGEPYEKAYYELFWNWFSNGKEVVQFS